MEFKELRGDCKINDKWKLKCPVCQSDKIEISEFSEFEKLLYTCNECKIDFILYAKDYKGGK